MNAAWRLAALLAAVLVGVGTAKLLGISDADAYPGYGLFVTALLGFGLYASTRGIDLASFHRQFRTVVLAVTLGVLAKAALITTTMYVVFQGGNTNYLVLGIAVAQIDPLSVAAMRAKSRMSKSAQTLIAAWASFDDPITVLLTVYATAFALSAREDAATGYMVEAGLTSLGWSLLWNLVLAAAVYVAWRAARGRRAHGPVARFAVPGVIALGVLTVAGVAVYFSLLLAFAIIGLFLRPPYGSLLDRLSQAAMLIATVAIGLLLADDVNLVGGAVLGIAAFCAQIVVASVLTVPRTWRGDRVRLALGQQNGLTAIILALILEPNFPGSVAIIGPAVIVVNLLHVVSNGLWDWLRPPVVDPTVDDEPEKLLQHSSVTGPPGLNCPSQATNAAVHAEPAD